MLHPESPSPELLAAATVAADAPASAETPRRGLVFAIIAVALTMMSINGTIVATALRALQVGLDVPVNWLGWTITAYAFGFVLMLPVSGALSDRWGRRRVFIVSVAVFTTASLLCGFATNIQQLIALRVLQAAGGAGFTPSATGIVVDHFGRARDRYVGLFGSIFPVGAMIGPVLGGLFVTWWSWRTIFWVNVPIGIVIVLLALRHIPQDPPRATPAKQPFDAIGMLLLGTGIFCGMLAATLLGNADVHLYSPSFLVPVVLALYTLAHFFHHIRRVRAPFILPRLIHGQGFGQVNLVNVVYGGVPSGVAALVPLYAANRYGINALHAGTLLIAQAAAAFTLSFLAAMFLRKTGYRMPIRVGGVVMACGVLLLTLAPPAGITPWLWLAGATLLVGAGGGALNPASRNAGLQLAPEHSATLASLRSMSMQIGAITTVSIATAILAASSHPGLAQAGVYTGAALVLLVALPLVGRIPEHHGAW